jgi:hypothetical protein
MSSHSRKLIVLAALCWVAPLSAHQSSPAVPSAKPHATAAQKNHAGCPRKAAAAKRSATHAPALASSDGVPAGLSIFDVGRSETAFLP